MGRLNDQIMLSQQIRIYLFKNFILSIFLFSLFSCGFNRKVDNLKINTNNALRVIIEFDTKKNTSPILIYWMSDDPDKVFKKQSNFSRNHNVALFALKPETNYNFLILENESILSDTILFTTASYPVREPFFNLTTNSGNVFNGYILIRKVEYPAQQIILNNKGRIVWYHLLDSAVSRFYSWTEDHTILSLNTEEHIQEIDLEGNILFDLKLGLKGFSKPLHHEIIKDQQGNIISLTRNMKLFDLSENGGVENDTIFGDGILVLDSTGNKVWGWDIYEHEDPLLDKDIERMKKDWSHGNALSIDLDGNYLVSFRNFHQIWKINSHTGEIIWKLGLDGDFGLNNEDIFYSQHSVFINRFRELMLFDNGLPETGSRAISFRIKSDSIAEIGHFNTPLPRRLYSFKEGSAYLITEDKILFSSTRNNIIVVTDKHGNILWELYSPEPIYRAYYLDENVFN
jgi:hypothetical protein